MAIEPESKLDIGQIGERVVCQWLRTQRFRIHHERWHCRFGELDIVASEPSADDTILAFVEVKARRTGNWDRNGLLAITPTKQKKLIKAARLYLGLHPQFEQYPCRFDVALVQVVDARDQAQLNDDSSQSHWVQFGHNRLRLRNYLRGAFEAD